MGRSEDVEVLIIHGVVPMLVQLLSSSIDHAVRDQALWALGNIAADSERTRDLVANHGALFQLLSLMWNPSTRNTSTWNIATWAFSIMFIRNRPVSVEQIQPALPALHKLLHQPDEEDALIACQTISVLFEWGSNGIIGAVIAADVFPGLVALLKFPTSRVLVPTLQIIGYIAAGDYTHTEILIQSGVLSCLKSLVTHTDEVVAKKVCWVISNIVCGKGDQLQAVIDEDLIRLLVNITKIESGIRKEAVLAIVNAVYHGDEESIRYLVSEGCTETLCDLLTCTDKAVVIVSLNGLKLLLGGGELSNARIKVEDCGGLQEIARLKRDDKKVINEMAESILRMRNDFVYGWFYSFLYNIIPTYISK